MHLDKWTTGTSSENTKNSFYYKIVTSIMKANTSGSYDATLTLLDAEYNVLVENDDSGYARNSLFNYTVEEDKAYILRVATYKNKYSGKIKVSITPDSQAVSEYEDIWLLGSNIVGCGFTSTLNTTRAICYTPGTSGTYRFTTKSSDDIDFFSKNV